MTYLLQGLTISALTADQILLLGLIGLVVIASCSTHLLHKLHRRIF